MSRVKAWPEDYLKPVQITELYPHISWNPSQIGYLFWMGLVSGRKIHNRCIVRVKDVLELHQKYIEEK